MRSTRRSCSCRSRRKAPCSYNTMYFASRLWGIFLFFFWYDELLPLLCLGFFAQQNDATAEAEKAGSGSSAAPPRPAAVRSFCKMLTASDTSTHGGFSVL
jgi:hypothetical protein